MIKVKEVEFLDLWLVKFYGLSQKQVAKEIGDKAKDPRWFTMYPVTEKQHEWWRKKTITKLHKANPGTSVYYLEENCLNMVDLNIGPFVSEDAKEKQPSIFKLLARRFRLIFTRE